MRINKMLRYSYSEVVPRFPLAWLRPLHPLLDYGPKATYFIRPDYTSRLGNAFYDDVPNTDHWQREVYEFARQVCVRERIASVCDVGCGSAYKLMTYLSDFQTLGIDLPPTVKYLREQYPDREWMENDFQRIPQRPVGMVIAADVIEHLPCPNELILYIQRLAPKAIVVSTPDRVLAGRRGLDGPPTNPAHVREWTFAEFHAYMSSAFVVEKHFISNREQGTQCVLCRARIRGRAS